MSLESMSAVTNGHSTSYLIAFGYAYGRMDEEDGNPCTSSHGTAEKFADHWAAMEASGASRPNMLDAWTRWRAGAGAR
jgi:hypothetical protein